MVEYYLVGGAVRDELLGRPVHDRDWLVIGATIEEMLAAGFQQVGQLFPVFLHPKTKEEYALARKERKQGTGYKGFSCIFDSSVTVEEDLYRRDLTINAIAQAKDGTMIDPYNGREDLKHRCLRHVSEAFIEDPLRVLRVARFAAQLAHLGFTVADETIALMRQIAKSGELATLTVERIWTEWHKALSSPNPECFLSTLRECNALEHLIPEINALFGIPQPENWHPEIDTGIHTLLVTQQITALSTNPKFRFVAQLHDLGKAKTAPDKWPSHANHEILGLDEIDNLSYRLKIPTEYHQDARLFCRFHTHMHKILSLKNSTILNMFNTLDLWRKPERVDLMMLCAKADYLGRKDFEHRDYPQSHYFYRLYQAALAIEIQSILKLGLKGEAIKTELNQQRLNAIAEMKEQLKEASGDHNENRNDKNKNQDQNKESSAMRQGVPLE